MVSTVSLIVCGGTLALADLARAWRTRTLSAEGRAP
jgi:hypothetical protein